MVPQVIDLNGMHGTEHQHAQYQHDPVRPGTRKPQRVVEGVVHLAQAGQEEHEGTGQRDQPVPGGRREDGAREPWQGEGQLAGDFAPA
jgi:hypothetical protein